MDPAQRIEQARLAAEKKASRDAEQPSSATAPKGRPTPPRHPRAGARSGNPGVRAAAVGQSRASTDAPGPVTWRDWVGGARIRTLPMALSPVLVGTGAAIVASPPGAYHWVRALLCLAIAVLLQIGVNFANDYSDGIRGTDAARVGPSRLVGSNGVSPQRVLVVALSFFGLAALAGLALTITTGLWWLLAVGAAAIVAAWFYTGGKRPYGYMALGEVFVFLFFGLVATLGTMYVQVFTLSQEAWIGAVGAGLIACGALEVNNLRDRAQDALSGKRTLAVLLGATGAKILYGVFLLVPFVLAGWLALFYPLAWIAVAGLLAALPACLITWTGRTPRELILALKLTGVAQLIYGIGLFVAFL